MSWTGPSPGIRVRGRADECAPVGVTSMSLVWVPATVEGCCDTLRLYGITALNAEGAFRYFDADASACAMLSEAEQAAFEPHEERIERTPPDPFELVEYRRDERGVEETTPDGRILYLDAIETDWLGRQPDFDFWLLPAPERGADPLLQSTCVPRHRVFPTFYCITYDYSASTETDARRLHVGPAIVYQDGPEVLRLPDGRWLMLLHSWTALLPDDYDFDGLTYSEARVRAGAKDCSMTDIVCYVANDAAFTDGLKGPFRVVDGKNALPASEMVTSLPVAPRLFVSVPAGVIVDDSLYVYYAFDTSMTFEDGNECASDEIGAGDATAGRSAYAAEIARIVTTRGSMPASREICWVASESTWRAASTSRRWCAARWRPR